MGYSSSGGPKGLGVVTDSNTPLSDFNKIIELIARVGNYRGPLTEAERDAITGDELYEGLSVFNTTDTTLEVYAGSGWEIVWPPREATGVVACPGTGSGTAPVYYSDLITVTFPVGLFSTAPKVFVQTIGDNAQVPFGGLVEQITASGCKVRGFRIGSVPSATFSVQWHAIQG